MVDSGDAGWVWKWEEMEVGVAAGRVRRVVVRDRVSGRRSGHLLVVRRLIMTIGGEMGW